MRNDPFQLAKTLHLTQKPHEAAEDAFERQTDYSLPFRKDDGTLIRGLNAEEARLHPDTLLGRADHSVTALPKEVSDAINDNILRLIKPDKLRERAALIYQALEKQQIQKAPEDSLDCDAHIAALFLQDYAHLKRVLTEVKKKVPHFSPDRVLDIGYGPATGMVALNEVMGDDFAPSVKELYLIGRFNREMKKRAKVILSRQLCELQEGPGPRERLGPIDLSKFSIKTSFREALPSTKQYDLIMVNQAMLTREYNFPHDVDVNLRMILRLLAPNGHLVIVERGNSLGFEIVARARQVMIRPESFEGEMGKIPRPYIQGLKYKPKRLRKDDEMVTDEDIDFERALLGEDTPKRPDEQFVDYHLSVVAPCPHHAKCPLQMGDPKYYKILNHKHRLDFCSFDHVVERPKYTLELKKGRRMTVAWDKNAEDGFGLELIPRNTLKKMAGSGRSGGKGTESGNFLYLVMHRAPNDAALVREIDDRRRHKHEAPELGLGTWGRVLEYPSRIKKNVRLNVCAPSGRVELWQVPKSLGKQAYHDARKVKQGDEWALEKKGVTVKNRLSGSVKEKLDRLAMTQNRFLRLEKQKAAQSDNEEVVQMAEEYDEALLQKERRALDLRRPFQREKL